VSSELLKTVHLKPTKPNAFALDILGFIQVRLISIDEGIADGDCVQVSDSRNRLVGSGLYNSKSKIRVRLLSLRHSISPDLDFFTDRIESALKLRQRSMPGATSFRVVNAESDFLSGLIIDKYKFISSSKNLFGDGSAQTDYC
jgi:23S rRNA (cytosine1962-C5)-methyltransferase